MKKESRSNEGVFYYVNVERKVTSWHLPMGPQKRPRAVAQDEAKKEDATDAQPKGDPHDRPCGRDEVRVWHIS